MGLLNEFFGIRGSGASSDGAEADDTLTSPCDTCGKQVPEDALDSGQCEDCASEYTGANYCCVAIYEEGEAICASCGEPL